MPSSPNSIHGHRHRRCPASNLDAGFADNFVQGRQNAVWLAEIVTEYSQRRGKALTPLQKVAVLRFHNDPIHNIFKEETSDSDLAVIEAYFRLFDELFFFGSLESRCTINLSPIGIQETNLHGECRRIKNGSEMVKWEIIMYLFDGPKSTCSRYHRMKGYIETLLHEMLHGFLQLWSCADVKCTKEFWALGTTGHGKAWQDAAFALEMAVQDKNFLNLDLKLDRIGGLNHELFKNKMRASKKEDLKRWKMAKKDVWKQLRLFRKYS